MLYAVPALCLAPVLVRVAHADVEVFDLRSAEVQRVRELIAELGQIDRWESDTFKRSAWERAARLMNDHAAEHGAKALRDVFVRPVARPAPSRVRRDLERARGDLGGVGEGCAAGGTS
jgi:hypothetical protein